MAGKALEQFGLKAQQRRPGHDELKLPREQQETPMSKPPNKEDGFEGEKHGKLPCSRWSVLRF